jgi:hypothetical protein
METVLIRACTRAYIDAIVQMERQWEEEGIAYGDFDPISREAWIDTLERYPGYFLVAECAGQIVGYINATVPHDQPVGVIPNSSRMFRLRIFTFSRSGETKLLAGS